MKKRLVFVFLSCFFIIFAGGHGVMPFILLPFFVLDDPRGFFGDFPIGTPAGAGSFLAAAGLLILLVTLFIKPARAFIIMSCVAIGILIASFVFLLSTPYTIPFTYLMVYVFCVLSIVFFVSVYKTTKKNT